MKRFLNVLTVCVMMLATHYAIADSKKALDAFKQLLEEAKKIQDQENAKQKIKPTQLKSTEKPTSNKTMTSSSLIRWPSHGGLEDWGFKRPSGCQAGTLYMNPLVEKLQKYSKINVSFNSSPNEYISGKSSQLIQSIKADAAMSQNFRNDIEVQMVSELNKLDEDGEQYIKIASVSYKNGREVIDAIKRFEIYGVGCDSPQGAANSMLCAIQLKALSLTDYLEQGIQVACHLGLNTPTYATANTVYKDTNSGSSNETSLQFAEGVTGAVSKNSHASERVISYTTKHINTYNDIYEGRGKKHNLHAEASKCLRWDSGRKQILNDCEFAVEAVFCAINPNNPNSIHVFEMAPYFNCAENSVGMWPIGPKSPLLGKFSSDSVAVFACKKPSIPGAKFNHSSQSFSGRCSEYMKDTAPDPVQYNAPF